MNIHLTYSSDPKWQYTHQGKKSTHRTGKMHTCGSTYEILVGTQKICGSCWKNKRS